MEIFSGIFVIIWVIALISFITKAVNASKGGTKYPQRPNTPYTGTQQQNAEQKAQAPAQTFRSVPSSTYGSSNTGASTAKPRNLSTSGQNKAASYGSQSSRYGSSTVSSYSSKKSSAMYGPLKSSRIRESSVLLEDRKNDWLAKQLKEEAAILKSGSIYDLGAAHEVVCEADRIKKDHIKRHNTNGLNRNMFR